MLIIILIIALIAAALTATTVMMTAPAPGGAVVTSFTVSPSFICRPGPVTLAWNFTGDSATLSSSPRVAETLGTVGRTGRATVRVFNPGSTQFVLDIRRGGARSSEIAARDVEMLNTDTITLGGEARCTLDQETGMNMMQRIDLRRVSEWSDDIRVHQISFDPASTERFTVTHNGQIVLSPTLETNDLRGVSALAGEWKMQRPIGNPNECRPNSPGWRGFPTFRIIARVECGM
jgi:hypothetical protein